MNRKKQNWLIVLVVILAFFLVRSFVIFPQQGQIICGGTSTTGILECSVYRGQGEPTTGDPLTSGGTVTFVLAKSYDTIYGKTFDTVIKPVLIRDSYLANSFFTSSPFCRFDGRAIYSSSGVGCTYWEQCPQFGSFESQYAGSPLHVSHAEVNSGCGGIVSQYDPSTPIAFILNARTIAGESFQNQLMIVDGIFENMEGTYPSQNFRTYAFCDLETTNVCTLQEPVLPQPCTDNSGCGWKGTITNITMHLKVNGYTIDDICTVGGICNQPPTQDCTSDTDCETGQMCSDNICIDKPTPPPINLELILAIAVLLVLAWFLIYKYRR